MQWELDILALKNALPHCFSSSIAERFKIRHRQRRTFEYDKLDINESNCSDMNEVYQSQFANHLRIVPVSTIHSNFKLAVRHYVRMTLSFLEPVAIQQSTIEILHEPGML